MFNFLVGIYKHVRFLVSIPKRCGHFEKSHGIGDTGYRIDYVDNGALYRTDRENKEFT